MSHNLVPSIVLKVSIFHNSHSNSYFQKQSTVSEDEEKEELCALPNNLEIFHFEECYAFL